MRSGKLQQRSYIKKVKAQELFPRYRDSNPHRRRDGGRDRVVDERFCSSPALVRQEEIPFDSFTRTRWGRSRVRLT